MTQCVCWSSALTNARAKHTVVLARRRVSTPPALQVPPSPPVRTPERVAGHRWSLASAELLAAEAEVFRLD